MHLERFILILKNSQKINSSTISLKNYHKPTFSINIHPLTVVLLWCDWTPEQGSWSTATQQTLSCSLWGPHQDPEETSVTY